LADTLNFTRAAELCDVSQPALSRAIKKLEEELGAPLVRRERGRTHLTDLGARIRPRLEQSLALAEAAKSEADEFARMDRATLTLGVMCTIGPARLIALVDHLTRELPEIELRLLEGSGPAIVERLLAGEFDVALAGMPAYPDEVAVQSLYQERYVVAFPSGHRFETMPVVPRRELRGERYLQRINCEYPAHVAAEIGPYDMPVEVLYESEHEDWIQAMIIAGMGCACMPEFMPLYPELKTRVLTEPELSRTISILTVRGRPHSPVVRLFHTLSKAALARAAAPDHNETA
ncbi:MAG: LysR family transcriptional regulator, partial [Pseudomonadota bacterium]